MLAHEREPQKASKMFANFDVSIQRFMCVSLCSAAHDSTTNEINTHILHFIVTYCPFDGFFSLSFLLQLHSTPYMFGWLFRWHFHFALECMCQMFSHLFQQFNGLNFTRILQILTLTAIKITFEEFFSRCGIP